MNLEDMREQAVEFAKSVILRSNDWQQVADALANSRFHDWIMAQADDELDSVVICQSIILQAENALGDRLPVHYQS